MRTFWLARGAKGAALLFIGVLIFGCVVMALWNALIPELFHGPALSYWQAIGLLVLTKIFFGGHWMGARHQTRNHWKRKFEAKLADMTPEDREKFKEEWKKRCGYDADMKDC